MDNGMDAAGRPRGRISRLRRLGLLAVIAALVSTVLSAAPSFGAAPLLDTIRVAIFIDLPGKYQLRTPAATFSSQSGMTIGLRKPAGIVPGITMGAGEVVRTAIDNYRVRLLATDSAASAAALLNRLQSLSGSGAALVQQQGGKTVYLVTEGSYPTAAEAQAALEKWRSHAELRPLLGEYAPSIAGPLHLDAGTYPTIEDARRAAAALGDFGVEVYIAVLPSGAGGAEYKVLAGAEADAAGLEAVHAAAGGALAPFRAEQPYLLLTDGYAPDGSRLTHVLIPADGSAKVWIQPGGEGAGIKLAERYGRTYRGSFEVTALHERLAVVNELPFEQYLYAVVGAEMPASWPAEALKAQAVAARSYALHQGFGFQIAHVVDSTHSQAYGGMNAEKPQTTAAVDATRGEVLMHNGRVVEAVFSSSAGGVTADPAEIWGGSVAYLGSVPSPDELSEEGLYHWYRVVLSDGRTGYIREDLVEPTGERTSAGSPVLRVAGDGVNVRPIPLIQSNVEPVARVDRGTRVVQLEKVVQSNEMSWVRGPYTPAQLAESIKGRVSTPIEGNILSLEAGRRGPSGRVVEVLVNGERLEIRVPDTLRSALGGLPSTRFEIDEMGRIAMVGRSGAQRETPFDNAPVYAVGAAGETVRLDGPGIYILNGEGEIRAAASEPAFRFTGTGYGHGVGMSQWGARALAERGYDYQSILKYYYKNVTIEKNAAMEKE